MIIPIHDKASVPVRQAQRQRRTVTPPTVRKSAEADTTHVTKHILQNTKSRN